MSNIKLMVFDVDGTLTDGKIYIDNNGVESKTFNVKDGMAITHAIKKGIICCILTGRTSNIVKFRAHELNIKEVHQGVKNKIITMEKIKEKYNVKWQEILYIGDDINDIEVMKKTGTSACPSDAVKRVKNTADIISSKKGGEGAIRDILEIVFEKQGIEM